MQKSNIVFEDVDYEDSDRDPTYNRVKNYTFVRLTKEQLK